MNRAAKSLKANVGPWNNSSTESVLFNSLIRRGKSNANSQMLIS